MDSGTPLTAARPGEPPPGARTGAPGQRVLHPEFTGSAREYFRIWIVNLFFTLITFGIYSAWAKVRKKRYFYGSTRLDGDSFDYFGSPKVILKGRIVAVVIFVTYAFVGELYPTAALAFWAVAIVALPWLIVRAFTFNARNSAYRGLRFDFSGTTGQAARIYIGRGLVVALTFGLAYPWFMARQKAFVVSHHALGTTGFGCEISAGDYFAIYVIAALIFGAAAFPLMMGMGFLMAGTWLPEQYSFLGFLAPMVLMYAVYAMVYAYLQARTANLMWNGTYGAGIRFSSSLGAWKLGRIYIGNAVAVACTAGLLIPWAVVRTLRYRLESLTVTVDEGVLFEANPALERVGATGQELGDIFNLDLGI